METEPCHHLSTEDFNGTTRRFPVAPRRSAASMRGAVGGTTESRPGRTGKGRGRGHVMRPYRGAVGWGLSYVVIDNTWSKVVTTLAGETYIQLGL